MARQITYDATDVRRRILETFWATGYAETSLSDLEEATGLNRRQLYNGPGDKKAMFLLALDDFSDVAGRQFLAPLETDQAGLADIATLLRTFVALAPSAEGSKGCLVCTTSQEEIADDPDVRIRVEQYLERIEAAYQNALRHASERGEASFLASDVPVKSALLLGVHVALCVLGRAGYPNDVLEQMAEGAIAAVL